MTVRMRHTRSQTANRRSHHALEQVRLSKCPDCSAMHLRHRVCQNCGKYRGKAVGVIAEARVARASRRADRLKAMGEQKKSEEKEEKASAKA